MQAKVRFRCGCPTASVDIDKVAQLRCPACGERKVARVFMKELPRFVGHGRGPLMRSEALEAVEVNLAPAGALKLKPRKDDDGRPVR